MTEPWSSGPWVYSPQDGDIVAPGARVAHVRLSVDDPPRHFANARLIAAAPEMAEVVRSIAEAVTTEDLESQVNEARALLARIRGEAS